MSEAEAIIREARRIHGKRGTLPWERLSPVTRETFLQRAARQLVYAGDVHAVEPRKANPAAWTVEGIGDDGEVYQAIFVGPRAEHRAREYAGIKYAASVAEIASRGTGHGDGR